MKSFFCRLTAAAGMALLALHCISAYAEQIPTLADVPDHPDDRYRIALAGRRAALSEERAALKSKIDQHNQRQAEEGSAEEAELRREGGALRTEMQRHVEASRTFNQAVDAFGRIAAVFAGGLANTRDRGVPLNAPLTNDEGNRSAFNYAKVIDQFRVEQSERYAPGEKTYCNIFAWDVTRALGAEIPHYVIKDDPAGASAVDELGQFKAGAAGREELDVNRTVGWLKEHGPSHGWQRVDARMAQEMANGGHPAVAVWPNPGSGKHGHIAVIRPGSLPLQTGGVAIAQAGRLVLNADHLDAGFNDPELRKPVQYWRHD